MNVSEITEIIRDYSLETELVNTVTYSNEFDIDIAKTNIYPLVNIEVINYVNLVSVIEYNIKINVLSNRAVNKEQYNDKLYGDNKVDNYNTAQLIFNEVYQKMVMDYRFEFNVNPSVRFISKAYANMLDGIEVYLVVQTEIDTKC